MMNAALAANASHEACFEYTTNKKYGGITLTKYIPPVDDNMFHVNIPSEIDGQAVMAIGSECFKENGMLIEKITVPDGVRCLEHDAFAYCVSLSELFLPDSIERLEAYYLLATGLDTAFIPSGVTEIERPELIDLKFIVDDRNERFFSDGYALYMRTSEGDELLAVNASDERDSYDIPEGVVKISADSVKGVETLESLRLPSTLIHIDEGSLSFIGGRAGEKQGINNIVVDDKNPVFTVRDGLLTEKQKNGSLKALRYMGGEHAIVNDDISCIGRECFKNKNITELTIHDELTDIHKDAFYGISLKYCNIIHKDINKYNRSESRIYFGKEDKFSLQKLLDGFGANGKLYDFEYMDSFLIKDYFTEWRIGMMLMRLKNPYGLTEENRKAIYKKINDNLDAAVKMTVFEGDLSCIDMMGELGFFTVDNIEHLILLMTEYDKKEMTAWFMTYKNLHFTNSHSALNDFLL